MLDINLIREKPNFVKKNLQRRKHPIAVQNLHDLIKADKDWRKNLQEVEKLKHEKNKLTSQLAQGRDSKLIARSRQLNEKIKKLDAEVNELATARRHLLDRIPNLLHKSVPYGRDDSENKEIRTWGEKPKFDFELKGHEELMLNLNLVDIERAAKTAGARFFYLKNEAVILEQSLLRFAVDFLIKKGFEIVTTPNMIRKRGFYGTGFIPGGEEDLYKIEGEDLYLIGTSEVSVTCMHMDEVIERLPLKYAGITPCYRTEAGSHGKDTKGIFRVHQFNKVEQLIFCKPEDSWEIHEELIANAEKIQQKLKLPYRVVNICTGDLGGVAAKKYDIETWMPVQQKYRETVSCSNCTDYQARRLNTKYRTKEGLKYVHTLNSTALATNRIMVAIIENFQKKDGSVKIPAVLHKYTGFKKLS